MKETLQGVTCAEEGERVRCKGLMLEEDGILSTMTNQDVTHIMQVKTSTF